jgi:hypothetical protein
MTNKPKGMSAAKASMMAAATQKPANMMAAMAAAASGQKADGVKMYPEIRSRVLPGYAYPSNYPNFFNAGPLANSDLPADMLNKPISFKHAKKGYLTVVQNSGVYNNGQNDGQAWKPATGPTATKWIIRKTGGGYTVELAAPKGAYKYLATPTVCFTPLANPDAAMKDEPWPLGRVLGDGSTAPYKYPVQGPEWSDTKFVNKGPCPQGKNCTKNGMFGTPKWWPTAQLIKGADVRYAVWNVTYNRATKAIAFSSPRRPHTCGTRLDVFPVANDAYWSLVRMTHAGAYFTAVYDATAKTVAPSTDAPGTNAPGTDGPDAPTPEGTTAPYDLQPLVIGGTDVGLNISNKSENANNILNQAAQGGGGGIDETSAALIASLLAAQNGGAVGPEIIPGGTLPYPNPYALPLPPGTDAPTETPAPSVADMLASLQTPVPTPAPAPFYSSPAFVVGGIVVVVAIAVAIWWFFIRRKGGASANGGSAGNGSSNGGNRYSGGNATGASNGKNYTANYGEYMTPLPPSA